MSLIIRKNEFVSYVRLLVRSLIHLLAGSQFDISKISVRFLDPVCIRESTLILQEIIDGLAKKY